MDAFWILKAYSFAFSAKSYSQYEYGDKVCMPNSVLDDISRINSDLLLTAKPLVFSVKPVERENKVRKEYARRYRNIYEDQEASMIKKRCAKIEGLLDKYKGNEHVLYLKMCDKYGVEQGSRLPQFPSKTGNEIIDQMYCSVLEFTAPEPMVWLPHWFMQNLGLQEGTLVRVQRVEVPKAVFLELQPQANGFNNMLQRYGSKELLESCLIKYSVLTVGQVFVIEWRGRPWSIRVLSAKPERTVGLVDSDPKVELTPLPFDETDRKELERLAEEPEMKCDIRVESFSKYNVHEQEQMALAMKHSLAEKSGECSDEDDKPLTELYKPTGKGTPCPHCGKFIERNFGMHEMHCRRRGPKHKCKWCRAFKTLQHEIDCGNKEENCTGCGAIVQKRLLSKHICPVPCNLCGRKVLPSELDLHILTDCPKRQTYCEYCKLPVLFSELIGHMDYCGSRTDPCELCNHPIAKSKMEEHLKSSCPTLFPNLIPEVPFEPGTAQILKPFLPALPQSWGTNLSNVTDQKTPEIDVFSRLMTATESMMQAPNDPFYCPHCSKDFFDFNALQKHLDGDDCIILKARTLRKKASKASRLRPRMPDRREKEFIKEKFNNTKWLCVNVKCGWINGRAKLRCMRCNERRPPLVT